jgi:hypothetical protein
MKTQLSSSFGNTPGWFTALLTQEVRSETSWAKATPNDNKPDAQHDHSSVFPPIVSQVKINGSTLLVTGRPIIIGSADDPYSTRQFQLTATQFR